MVYIGLCNFFLVSYIKTISILFEIISQRLFITSGQIMLIQKLLIVIQLNKYLKSID